MRTAQKFLILFSVILATSGCWIHTHYRHGPPSIAVGAIYISAPPPAPIRRRMPPRPSALAVWIDGYWRWTGAEYFWVNGYWDANPPAGRNWVPGFWTHSSRGWYWTPGRWK